MDNDTLARTLGVDEAPEPARYYLDGPHSMAGDVCWRVRDRRKESPAVAVFIGKKARAFAVHHLNLLEQELRPRALDDYFAQRDAAPDDED